MSAVYTTPREAVRIMARVVFATILRETKSRYGRLKIGYLWAFIEPIMFISILSILFTYVRDLRSADMPEILFYVTGILPFFMFRNVMTQCMAGIRASVQLLTFPQVQVFDLLLARALLELVTFFIVFTVIVSLIALADINPVDVEDYLRLGEAILYLFLLGFGGGVAAAALIPLFPTFQFLLTGVLLRPLFFISGIFFTADVIPDPIRPYALLNPLLNCTELFRSAFFHEFESEYVDRPYVIGFVLVTLFLGLLLQRALKRHATRIPI